MKRLVAYLGNEPERLACALFPARSALHVQMAGDARGWGLGFVQGGDVLLQKRPRPESGEVDFFALSRDLRAEALVARAGMGDEGSAAAEDADPFRFRSWLFGSAGQVSGFEAIRERLLESVPDFLRRNLRGRSASEHLFHLFLAFLHDAGMLDMASPKPDAIERSLQASVTFFERLLTSAGAPPPSLALLATNGRCLVASSRPHPVHYLEVNGIPDCPVCQRREGDGDGRRISHETLRAVVVEADGGSAGRPGWRAVPAGSSLVMGLDRVVRVIAPP